MTPAPALREARQTLRASPIFESYVLVTLAVAGIIGLITVDVIDLGMSHFGDRSHRTHDIAYGLLFTTGVVGMVAQLRRPMKNIAGMVMALTPAAALLVAAVLSADVDRVVRFNPLRYVAAVTVVAALLHPAGRAFFASFRVSRLNWRMLVLVAVAAVPLLTFASTSIGLQRTVGDMHAGMGHYAFTAALCYTVIGVGVMASVRPEGWRLAAWIAGLLPALLGLTSMLYPEVSSSLSRGWAVAAVAWGAAYVVTAARTDDPVGAAPMPSPPFSSRPSSASET